MPKSLLKLTLSAADTADHLSRELGGKASHWSIWLANDRKPSRVNRRLPQEPGPGRPRYNAAMVDTFVAEYKKDHLQTGPVGSHAGLSKDRRITPHISAMTLADGADPAAVLFVIPKPLVTFILSVEEARHLAARLIKAANEIDSESSQRRGGGGVA